jgi:hypothetical protein
VGKDDMEGYTANIVEDEATGIGLVVRIFLNNFAVGKLKFTTFASWSICPEQDNCLNQIGRKPWSLANTKRWSSANAVTKPSTMGDTPPIST